MDTKNSILDAAEHLFAERGFEATSMRAITRTAGVNLAAVNYHFRSKEGLLQALFTRRLDRLNLRRMEMMDRYEAEYGERPIPLEKLVRALIGPMFEGQGRGPKSVNTFGMLMGRMYSAPQSSLEDILLADIRIFAERYERAIRRTLPDVPMEDLYWRTFFSLGATVHTLASTHILRQISRGACDPGNRETALEKVTDFIVAGLSAAARMDEKKKHRPKARKKP